MKKILIIHGPNINLIGLKSAKEGSRITIDKIDRAIRKKAKELNVELKILRTHDEAKAVAFVQRNRKTTSGIIISPSSWHRGGFTISDTIHFLEIPYSVILNEAIVNSLFNKGNHFNDSSIIESYLNGLIDLKHKII
jgi:3-dehydroquinate dehydratase